MDDKRRYNMYTSIVFSFIFSTFFCNSGAVKVSGYLQFPNGTPENIPDGSHLHVTLQDDNIMDTEAKHLGRFTHRFKDHKHTGIFQFLVYPPYCYKCGLF